MSNKFRWLFFCYVYIWHTYSSAITLYPRDDLLDNDGQR
jgi:hypothetical protein